MKEIHHFLEGFLCLVLTGYILECNAGLLLYIHLGVAFANSHHSAAFRHPPGHPDNHAHQ